MKNLAFTFALVLVSTFTFAQSWWGSGTKGTGPIVKETLNLEDFTSFKLGIAGDVYLSRGNTQKVVVEGQQNIIDELKTDVSGGTWSIGFKNNVSNYDKFKIYITIPTIDGVIVSGSGDVYGKDKFTNLGDIRVSVSGSGGIELDVEAKSISSTISGSGDIELEGSADAYNVRISGSGDVEAYGLMTKNCEASISGSGDIHISASETLVAKIVGSGDISYKGSPSVKSKIVGSGDVYAR